MIATVSNRGTTSKSEEERVLDAVCKWIETARAAGYHERFTQFPTAADFWHSALLRRLLDGKEPLPHPPPTAYSYPWYELIENGEGDAIDVWVCTIAGTAPSYQDDTFLMVEQSRWDIIEDVSNDEYVITYRPEGERFRITRGESIGNDNNGNERHRWHLKREDAGT